MRRKLVMLSVLYFVQGLPYGFQLTALPVYLRSAGVSLTGIGLASLLSLPWMIKVIWGPLVDRWGSERFGRRRSWIVPLQLGLAAAMVVAAWIPPERGLVALVASVLAMNLFAATMDVAVDGLAVDVLRKDELGYGNIAQVVGYKVGILTGGGLLVWASGSLGWKGLFLAMAALVGVGCAITLGFREPSSTRVRETVGSFGDVVRTLLGALRVPGTLWLLLFVATYKLGESMADAMFRPFLFDAGYTREQIGLWIGTWGMVFSLAGSFLGGILASRIRILHALAAAALFRAVAVGGEWWLSLVGPTLERTVAVIAAEQLFGGAVTTAMFAYMMSRVDRRIGATHYTLLATVEVLGKQVASIASGALGDAAGYPTVFGVGTVLALLFLLLLIPMDRAERASAP